MPTDAELDATRRVRLIDDLLGAILLLAALALAVVLDLTRRRICAVHHVAFALFAPVAAFVLGGLVDHHLANEHLHLALHGAYLSSALTTSYVYLPLLTAAGATGVVLLGIIRPAQCRCACCCLEAPTRTASARPSLPPTPTTPTQRVHPECFAARVRACASLYALCWLGLFAAIGTRLNVRLRESAINPVGGTIHWAMLRSPFFLALAHTGSVLLVGLKWFLQHAECEPLHHEGGALSDPLVGKMEAAQLHPAATTSGKGLSTTPTPATRRSRLDLKTSSARPAQLVSTPLTTATGANAKGPRGPGRTVGRPNNNRHSHHHHHDDDDDDDDDADSATHVRGLAPQLDDGDVSSLISSDSESDDGVLQPNFRATAGVAGGGSSIKMTPIGTAMTAMTTRPPRPVREAQPPLQPRPSGLGSRRPSGGSVASGPTASPPPSPTPSTASTGSSSFSTSRPRATRTPTTMPAAAAAAATGTMPRPRLSSTGSSTSTSVLSDSEELVALGSHYYNAPQHEYHSDHGPGKTLRRRATPTSLAGAAHSEWVECLDAATGSAYYYNARTGESRWKAV